MPGEAEGMILGESKQDNVHGLEGEYAELRGKPHKISNLCIWYNPRNE